MAHDVFISHSSIDKKAADAICHSLEQNGVKCWIAPRDIPPGANFGGEIIKGIKDCKVFLLVFSKDANNSTAVAKEVERAVLGYKKIVLPFRIEDVAMNENLEFFLTDVHWLDAFPDDTVFFNLVTAVKNVLGMPTSDSIPKPQPDESKIEASKSFERDKPITQGDLQQVTVEEKVIKDDSIAPSVPKSIQNTSIPPDADIFTPQGTITVIMEDGSSKTGIANTVLFVQLTSLYINDEVTLPLRDFKTIEVDPMGMGEAKITDVHGNTYDIEFEGYHSISFLSTEVPFQKTTVKCLQMQSVVFNWESKPQADIKYMLIESQYDNPCVVPTEFTQFMHVTWSDPLRGLPSFSGQPSQITTSLPIFIEEVKIPSNEIDIPADEITSIAFKSLGKIENVDGSWHKIKIAKKNGEIISAYTRTWSSIKFRTNEDIVERSSTNIKRITFL